MKRFPHTDTSPEAEKVQIELIRGMSITERLNRAHALTQSTRRMAKNAIAKAKPNLSDQQRELFFIEVHYGKSLAQQLRSEVEYSQ